MNKRRTGDVPLVSVFFSMKISLGGCPTRSLVQLVIQRKVISR